MDERVDKRQASGRKREALSDLAKSLLEGPRRSATGGWARLVDARGPSRRPYQSRC